VTEQLSSRRDRGYYRRIWLASTGIVATIFLVPFALLFLLFDIGNPTLKRTILTNAPPCLAMGLAPAIVAGHRAVWFLHKWTERIARAHELAQVRERERDLAQAGVDQPAQRRTPARSRESSVRIATGRV
jgi:hypothetical protein